MHFAFTAEQEEMRRGARRFLDGQAPLKRVREVMATTAGYDAALWRRIGAELGWPMLIVPERYGGAGQTHVEMVGLMEEMGRALFCGPFFSSVCLAINALLEGGNEAQKENYLPGLASGQTIGTLALLEASGRWDAEGVAATWRRDGTEYVLHGAKQFVTDGHIADWILVAAREAGSRREAGIALFWIDAKAAGMVRRLLPTMDQTRRLAEVRLDGVRASRELLVGEEGGGWRVIRGTLDRAAAALAAEQVGGAQRCLDMAVEHAKVRVQFGKPIGSFQAIKHTCANLLVLVESARSAAYYAGWCATHSLEELPAAAALAKATASEAFYQCAADNIQVHGGMGFTWEHDAHLFFKRARAGVHLLGDPASHRERYGEEQGWPSASGQAIAVTTIPRLLFEAAERFGTSCAISPVGDEPTCTFEELAAAALDVCRALMASGIERGDRVAIWALNSRAWVVWALGVHCAGGVLLPLNTRFKGAEAGYILRTSGAKMLFVGSSTGKTDLVALLQGVEGGYFEGRPVKGLPDLRILVVETAVAGSGADSHASDVANGRWSLAELLARSGERTEEEARQRALSVAGSDLSDLMFTSGTTGHPKGVMSTHAQTLENFRTWSEVVGLRAGDRYLIVNPFFHTFGYKAGWLACLVTGATNVPVPVFDAERVMQIIERERVTVLPGPPTLYHSLLNHPARARHDLSSLRLAVTGAATIPVELIRRMRDELRFETVLTAYGLTECCGVATMCRRGDDPETIANTSGRAIPGTEVKVVDSGGAEARRGDPGEVVIRGYNVMKGYWQDPAQTATVIDADGWLRTGNIGVMDERGNLRITDRTRDMFIVGGFNAYPAEIENLFSRNPKIAQVAVIGVPDERLGEVGMAFVIPRPGATLTESELIEWARQEMANYKAPRYVEIVDSLPLNATGKVMKFKLRELAAKRLRSD